MPSSQEIRQQFIDFFVKKAAHTEVPSSPVVPLDDPTLLFTNAGMNQFKDVFLGLGTRAFTRAVDTQKCIRAGGKHNDLDDVGKDTYHHTFFEMLGNWSFGDYFKKEAIAWAWELLTEVWGLDKDRLYITVFAGDEKDGLEPDTEAEDLWKSLTDVDPSHITRWDKKDNFWEMGETGPCGPCSEIHYDMTPDKSGGDKVNLDDPLVIEIWNLVFIQFNRDTDGSLNPLPAKHIDTGMGFERICCVLQDKTSNYDTDVFTPLFNAIKEVTGAPAYGAKMDDPKDTAYRIIADHIRTLTFAISDGAHCGNEGRNYVLRRILRRAVFQGRHTLGVNEPFFYKLVDAVVENFGGVFPELKTNPGAVAEELKEEEELFGRTLDNGVKLFEAAASKGGKAISGEDAFELYSTYGFPLDLTQVMAEERGMTVDVEGFEKAMADHADISKGKGSGVCQEDVLVEIVQRSGLPATEFTGYTLMDGEAELVAMYEWTGEAFNKVDELQPGTEAAVVTNVTPFYAESGGQVGDTGVLVQGEVSVEVADTRKIGDVYFHMVKVVSAGFKLGEVKLQVTRDRRMDIMKNHTSTHLLNKALKEVLGDHVAQKGSLQDAEKTRFDFSHSSAVTPDEIREIQRLVCHDIHEDLPVHTGYGKQEEAVKINGLRAVFGEKYPPVVRVVSIGAEVHELLSTPEKEDWKSLSIEFCGGTHLNNTGEAEAFAILSEEAVAKGIRRITAVTGQAAEAASVNAAKLRRVVTELNEASPETLAQQVSELAEKVNGQALPLGAKYKLRESLEELQKKVKAWKKDQAKQAAGDIAGEARGVAEGLEGELLVHHFGEVDGGALRTAMDVIKKMKPETAMLLAGTGGGKVALLAVVPDEKIKSGLKAGDWVKATAQVVGGGGGGRPNMAQAGGKDPGKINEAIATAKEFAASALG